MSIASVISLLSWNLFCVIQILMPKITVKCGYWVQPQSSYYIILAVGMLTVARVGLTICSNPERQGAGGCRRPRWGPGATSLGGVRGQSPLMGPGVKALWWGLGATPLGEGQGSKPLGRGQGSKPLGGSGVKAPWWEPGVKAPWSWQIFNTGQKSPSGCIEFYAAFSFCIYPLFPINCTKVKISPLFLLPSHTLSYWVRECVEKQKLSNI